MKEYKNFYIFLLAIIILFLVPNLLQEGMFVDGLWYATISNNLANGLGTFWQPMFTETMFTEFYEHPPLVFGIQSIFFKIFGASLWVEKGYAIVVFLTTIFCIKSLWKEVFHADKVQQQLWFIPVLLWFLCETVYLMYTNNVLECTQTIFILISINFILKGIRKQQNLLFLIAGFFTLLAFLSKGVTGLFPLVAVLIHQIIYKNLTIKQLVSYNGLFVIGFSLIFILFLIDKDSFLNISSYLENQVLKALNGNAANNIRESRFYILKQLLQIQLIPIAFVVIVSALAYFKNRQIHFFRHKKSMFFFFLIGLSGSLPIMFSLKQAAYYLITTIPFFAIVLSLIFIQNKAIIEKLKVSKIFFTIGVILMIGAILVSFNNVGKINTRDRVLLQDLEVLYSDLIKSKGETIGCKTKRYDALYGYMMRKYQISLDTIKPLQKEVVFTDDELITKSFERLNLKTNMYHLFSKK